MPDEKDWGFGSKESGRSAYKEMYVTKKANFSGN